MSNLAIEVLKSHLVGNAIDSAIQNKPLRYSFLDGFEDGLNIGKAVAEQIQQAQRQQQEQAHAAVVQTISVYFIRQLNIGPSNLSAESALQAVAEITGALDACYDEWNLEFASMQIKQNIMQNPQLTNADKMNLSLFVSCSKIIIADKKKRGLR